MTMTNPWRNAVLGAKELTGVIPTSWGTLTRTQVAACAIGGLLCLLAMLFAPPLISKCWAYDDAAARGRTEQAAREGAGFRDDTCCSDMAYTANARWRIANGLQKYQPQPFYRGQILTAFGKDIMRNLGLDQPAQRGDWTVSGFGFGAVTHEMRGPGGTIGQISDDQEETVDDAVLEI
jgi:hypothetical protein